MNNHLLMHGPRHITTQTRDTENITHAVLDQNGVKATFHIPLRCNYTANVNPIIPNTEKTRPIRFQFPISQHMMTQWKEKVNGATKHTASSVDTDLTEFLSTLNTPTNTRTPSTTTTPDHIETRIMESVDTIQDIFLEGLRTTTNLFPTKAPIIRSARSHRSKFWQKTGKIDVLTLHNGAILLRQLIRLNFTKTQTQNNSHNKHIMSDD